MTTYTCAPYGGFGCGVQHRNPVAAGACCAKYNRGVAAAWDKRAVHVWDCHSLIHGTSCICNCSMGVDRDRATRKRLSRDTA